MGSLPLLITHNIIDDCTDCCGAISPKESAVYVFLRLIAIGADMGHCVECKSDEIEKM